MISYCPPTATRDSQCQSLLRWRLYSNKCRTYLGCYCQTAAELLLVCCSSVSVSGNWSYKLNGMLNTLHSCNLCPNEINLWTSIAKLIRRKPTTTRRRRVEERLQEAHQDRPQRQPAQAQMWRGGNQFHLAGARLCLGASAEGREGCRFGGHL